MPQFADITVKKNDGTTDIVYVGKSPAGGDSSPANWKADAHAAPYPGLKPALSLSAKWNGAKTARRVQVDYAYHGYATDSTTGIATKTGTVPFSTTCAIPQSGMSDTDITEACAQYVNLLRSALIFSCLKSGFSAN